MNGYKPRTLQATKYILYINVDRLIGLSVTPYYIDEWVIE